MASSNQGEYGKEIRSLKSMRQRRQTQFGRAIFIGVVASLLAVVFQRSLFWAETLRHNGIMWLRGNVPNYGWIIMMLVGVSGGVLAKWITSRYAPEAAGSGIPHLKGVLSYIRLLHWKSLLPVKYFGGLLAIGSGFSLGREGPTVQMGAAAGTMVSDILHVRPRERRHLTACGAGAGLAAAFNAPLAGVVFVIEELQRDLSPVTYGTALVASVIADIIMRGLLGQHSAFHMQNYPSTSLTILPSIVVLGIIAGCFGVLFNKSLLSLQKNFSDSLTVSPLLKVAMVGCVIGLAAWYVPDAIGTSHKTTESILQGNLPMSNFFSSMLVLFFVKWVLTLLSYSSGVPGGIFAPILVLGSVLGITVGKISALIFPELTPYPAVFAVIGMAAFFTAIVRAPLTGIVLILEMTGNYEQLLPLLTASMVAYLIANYFHSEPIYDALLEYDLQKNGMLHHPNQEIAIFELVVEPDSCIAGKQVRNAKLPTGCLLVSIQRKSAEMIPHGHTKIEVYDMLTFAIAADAPETLATVKKLLQSR